MAKIYWTDRANKLVKRSNVDGSSVEVIAELPNHIRGSPVAPDDLTVVGTTIYWSSTSTVHAALVATPFNNTSPSVVISEGPRLLFRSLTSSPSKIFAVDNLRSSIFEFKASPQSQKGRKLFSIEGSRALGQAYFHSGKVYLRDIFHAVVRELDPVDLRGSRIVFEAGEAPAAFYFRDFVSSGLTQRGDIVVDGDTIWWVSFGPTKLARVNKNGSGFERLLRNDQLGDPFTLLPVSLDTDGSDLFVTDAYAGGILRMAKDGGKVTQVVRSKMAGSPIGLSVV